MPEPQNDIWDDDICKRSMHMNGSRLARKWWLMSFMLSSACLGPFMVIINSKKTISYRNVIGSDVADRRRASKKRRYITGHSPQSTLDLTDVPTCVAWHARPPYHPEYKCKGGRMRTGWSFILSAPIFYLFASYCLQVQQKWENRILEVISQKVVCEQNIQIYLAVIWWISGLYHPACYNDNLKIWC